MIEYIINEKNNKFYINKKIPNDSRYPRWYNNKYSAPFIEIQFEITDSLFNFISVSGIISVQSHNLSPFWTFGLQVAT